MRVFSVFVFVYFFVNVKSESSKKICLKYSSAEAEGEANKCDIEATVLSVEEIGNLQQKCRNYLEAKYVWVTVKNAQITGLGSFDPVCRDVSLKQLAWVSWDQHKKFFNSTNRLWDSFLLSKYKIANNTKTDICALYVKTGDCQNGKDVTRNNIEVLIERIPIRYKFSNMKYDNKTTISSKEEVLTYKVLENQAPKWDTVTGILSFTVSHQYEPDLTNLLLTPDVPIDFYVEGNQLAKNTSSGWVVDKAENKLVSKYLGPGKKVNVTIIADRTNDLYNIRINFTRNFEDNTTETTTIALNSTEINDENPRSKETDVTPDKPDDGKNNNWIIIGIPVGFVILFAFAAFIIVKMNQDNMDWCCLCACCTNCWLRVLGRSRRHSYINTDSDSAECLPPNC